MRQRFVNEIAWVLAIERASLLTWPAREILPYSGWMLRFTDGLSYRPNSVAALDFNGVDVTAAIDAVEREYRSRGLKPTFQITPVTKPEGLAGVLAARGYVCVTPTLVCVADVEEVCSRCLPANDVQMQTHPNAGFDMLAISGSRSPADGRERLDVLSRITVPHVRVTIVAHGIGVACGVGAAAKSRVGINLMRTHADYRRRGYARQVLKVIADWAVTQGAGQLFLSVEEANTPARALYESAGFVRAYSYCHYRKG